MSSRPPPIPPENRSGKGTGEPATNASVESKKPETPSDPEKKGQQGNTKINTTHQGYQQDR
ncbi:MULTISPECIES: hypothetical protein [Sinorhizobium]|uniref:Uncharacterized protein n=1 Tax=Sinorhizobium psoraleae TaxID=520838 RepID=A0ABT4KDF3_9HYPH|nr:MULTISPECIES: hypothetical protein [Sinorhizobium]MCZ4089993.1 hypothetical protein [Sinorhizobium psoraleae]MDK1384663.1 hypothetical protein [Sinorhizobium sp. 7-81]